MIVWTLDPPSLQEAIGRHNAILAVNHRTRYVRQLGIFGTVCTSQRYIEYRRTKPPPIEYKHPFLGEEYPFGECQRYKVHRNSRRGNTQKERVARGWEPLKSFISQFPGLQELVWDSHDPIPRYILDSLLPATRLVMPSFELRSLYQHWDQLHDIDPDDYALATSVNLANISTYSDPYAGPGFASYMEEALYLMVAGLAPNLRSVEISSRNVDAGDIDINQMYGEGRPPWQGFFAEEETPTPKGRGAIDRLAFLSKIAPEGILDWESYIDFSKLKALEFHGNVYGETLLQELTDLAEQGAFAGLQTFAINIGYDNEDIEDIEEAKDRNNLCTRLFSSLPPLHGLQLWKPTTREVKSTLLQRHGATLKKLHLGGIFSVEEVHELHTTCPNLQKLHICVKRTQGDHHEVAVYKVLAKFPMLESLSLRLCITFDLTHEEESDKIKVAEQMRSDLANAAIDESLARSIFLLILRAHRAERPRMLTPFHHLSIEGVGLGHYFFHYVWDDVTEYLAASWSLDLERADVANEDCQIREIGDSQRPQSYRASIYNYSQENFDDWAHGELIRPSWEAVWPEAKGRSDWIHVWNSFPLQIG